MRLVVGVFALTALASLAHAEDHPPAPAPAPAAAAPAPTPATPAPTATATPAHSRVPLRVVRVMPESKQALLFDRERSTHVLAEVGGEVEGYTVDAIFEDEVTLSRSGTQIVLVAPGQEPAAVAKAHAAAIADAKPAADPLPLDPYADSGTHTDAVPAVVSAPEVHAVSAAPPPAVSAALPPPPAPTASLAINTDSAVSEHRTTAIGPAAPPPAVAAPAVAAPAPAPAIVGPTAPAAAAPPAAAPTGDVVVTRAEVNATLGNFTKLTADLQGNFSPTGIVLQRVAPNTIFARIGLRTGDVITAVDGMPVRSIDDAASVYAKVSTARAVAAQIVRNGASMTLHVTIQ